MIRKNPQQGLASVVWMCEIINTWSNNILLPRKTFLKVIFKKIKLFLGNLTASQKKALEYL